MGRRRKNPEHEKLPPNVYPNKYSYVWKPTSRESVTLTAIKDGLAALWKRYEETVNNRDRAMTFGRLWEKFLASAYYSDLSPRTQKDYLQHQKKLLAVFGKVPADSIKPEHTSVDTWTREGSRVKRKPTMKKAVCPAFTVGGMSEGT